MGERHFRRRGDDDGYSVGRRSFVVANSSYSIAVYGGDFTRFSFAHARLGLCARGLVAGDPRRMRLW
jgi:hypothetical protein